MKRSCCPSIAKVKETSQIKKTILQIKRSLSPSQDEDIDEMVGKMIREVHDKMMNELGFVQQSINLSFQRGEEIKKQDFKVFTTKNYLIAEKLLVFMCYSKGLSPGIWSRSLLIRSGIYTGSMIPYLEKAIQEGYGIILMNPIMSSSHSYNNYNQAIPSDILSQYIQQVWTNLIYPSASHHINFIAFRQGGSLLVSLIQKKYEDMIPRTGGICFIESCHELDASAHQLVRQLISNHGIFWECCDKPYGQELHEQRHEKAGCICLSAGVPTSSCHTNAAYTTENVMGGTFKFFESPVSFEYAHTIRKAKSASNNFERITSMAKYRRYDSLEVEDFDLLKVIGKGAFGKVMLVRKKGGSIGNGKIFAMKVLRKAHIFAKNQVEHTKAERRILQDIDHPFIVRLRFAFQSKNKLYLVMDYYPGGNLFFHLQKHDRFSEHQARFFAAQLVLAISYLHSFNIAYRDLKLENILMDKDGNLALTDFGLSREQVTLSNSARTFCGTAEYIAPELLKRCPYGKEVDWWGLGILLYEMMTGRTPFYSKIRKDNFSNILHQNLKFPLGVFSHEAKSFLRGLLTRDPTIRLGSGPRGVHEIMNHPFFKGIDFKKIYKKEVSSPYRPYIEDDYDFRNISSKYKQQDAKDTIVDQGLNTLQKCEFQNFTYIDQQQIYC